MIRARQQRGSIAPFMVLALGGALLATAYAIDISRMTNSAAQLKRATDAAALAVGNERVANGERDLEKLQLLARGYVRNNLGLDSELAERISADSIVLTQEAGANDQLRYKVQVSYLANPELLGGQEQEIRVHSTVEAQPSALEVALLLPNSGQEDARNLRVLRRQGKRFAEKLVEGRKDAWLALVPYSQSVNVSPDYTDPQARSPVGPSAAHLQRLAAWTTPAALRPVELAPLFRTGYRGLNDPRIPDRRANLLCLYRGMGLNQHYYWDRSPSGQFRVYYRHDLIENGSPGADPISWTGPHPIFGGASDTRSIVADKGCPSAPLLPLTNDLNKIDERLGQMSTRFNTNYAIAMGWGAMALSPAFRGSNGWNLPDDLPKDFKDDGGDSYKAIVMLLSNTDERGFDGDAYNFPIGENVQASGSEATVTQRFANLCESLRDHKLRFFLIAVGVDGIDNNDLGAEGTTVDGASNFRRIAGPGLARCAQKGDDITYIQGFDFAAAEGQIQGRLDDILADIRQQGSYVRLVE